MKELSEEKKQWLKSIGAGEFPVPVKFIYTFDHIFNTNTGSNWFLDMDYVKDTALEELQAQYEENKKYFQSNYVNKTTPEVPVQEQPKYEVSKEYKTKLENGTNLIVSIDLQLTNFAKKDFQEMLSKFAIDSHSFYLYIAENIIGR